MLLKRSLGSADIYFADSYHKLCTIEADLSRAPILSIPKAKGRGKFYRVDYDIVLLFGMTELKAQLAWTENVSKTSSYICFNFIDIFYFVLVFFYREKRFGKF